MLDTSGLPAVGPPVPAGLCPRCGQLAAAHQLTWQVIWLDELTPAARTLTLVECPHA
jgi:hypothetical protein